MITSVMMVNSIIIITVNMSLLLRIIFVIIIITGSINIVTNHWIMSCQVTNDYLVSYWPLIPNLILVFLRIIATPHGHWQSLYDYLVVIIILTEIE